jgi:hypothetical protein
VNRNRYLLLEPGMIDDLDNARLCMGLPAKEASNPLFGEDRAWEIRFDNLYANVIRDGDQFRLWYNPFIVDSAITNVPVENRHGTGYHPIEEEREMGVCYATSRDGLSWVRPDLGLVEYDGSTCNNIVLRDIHGVGIWKDDYDTDPQRRYKALRQNGRGWSPDGLRWTLADAPGIGAVGDTHNYCVFDPETGQYVGITRLWIDGERVAGRTTSPDFRRWTKAEPVLRADEPGRQVYALLPFPHAGAWLGVVMLLNIEDDTVDCELAWSPDTVAWHRICSGESLIPRGEIGEWDWGCIYGAACPIEHNGRILLYYGGSDDRHGGFRAGGFGLATLRSDGYAGYEPIDRGKPCEIVTRPVMCTGDLCVSTDGGTVRVGVLGGSGLGVDDCDPVEGTVTDAPVTWNGDGLAVCAGKEIQLVFHIEDATVWSFSFA